MGRCFRVRWALLLFIFSGVHGAQAAAPTPPCDVAILGTAADIAALRPRLSDTQAVRVRKAVFHTGRLGGLNVVLGPTEIEGMGAAGVAALTLERFAPRRLVVSARGRAAHPALEAGDIVLGARVLAVGPNGHAQASMGGDAAAGDDSALEPGPRLLAAAREAANRLAPLSIPSRGGARRPRVARGTIVSGARDVSDPLSLRSALHASALDADGAAVAAACENGGVSCLVMVGIRVPAAEEAGSSATVSENMARLAAGLIRELGRGAAPASLRRGTHRWLVAYELAFGDAAPYSRAFPSLYDENLSYQAKRSITQYALDRITRLAVRETGVRVIRLEYAPGAYKDYPVMPSAQLTVDGTMEDVADFMAIVGYLAQQTEVIASTRVDIGGVAALHVVASSRGDLAKPATVELFWKDLRALKPDLPGFSGGSVAGRPGLFVIATEGQWSSDERRRIVRAVKAASTTHGVSTTARFSQVAVLSSYNNWILQPHGEAYLGRLTRRRRSDLVHRLQTTDRKSATEWITSAYQRGQSKPRARHGSAAVSSLPATCGGFGWSSRDPVSGGAL